MRRSPIVISMLILLAACGRLGLGEQSCEPHVRVPTPANILAAQSVPTARYTPCFVTIDPGWDRIDFDAESGRAGIAIVEGTDTFLAAIVTEACDVGDAVRRDSGIPDIERFEDVTHVPSLIAVAVVTAGPEQLGYARGLIEAWQGVELDERPVQLTLHQDATSGVSERLVAAAAVSNFVWFIDELDAAESTVELRVTGGETLSRVTPVEALDRIEDLAPTPLYEGSWYFTFEGGCITYLFKAEKRMADMAPVVAERNLGFYPAFELWEGAAESNR